MIRRQFLAAACVPRPPGRPRRRRARATTGLVMAALLAAAPAAAHPLAADEGGLANVEDMVATPDGRWVFASSMAGGAQASGALYVIDAGSRVPIKVFPAAGTTSAAPGCPGPVKTEAFAPHGLSLAEGPSGVLTLYVVNHGGREAIETFAVEGAPGAAPRLRWTGCIPLPPGAFPNGVAASEAGDVFATDMGQLAQGAGDEGKDVRGRVLVWRAGGGWSEVPGSRMTSPNGLVASPDGRRVYVAAWAERRLVEIDRDRTGEVRAVAVDFMPDNLRWTADGAILAAGQAGAPEQVVKCFMSASTSCGQHYAVARLDPGSMQLACTQAFAAGPRFNTATVAAPVGAEAWLGTTRGDRIGRMSLTPPEAPGGPCGQLVGP